MLRQIETLQTQYSLASENWQGIETSLTSRVTALEKDRDEAAKRESDLRRKARDANSKARRLEEELDSLSDRNSTLEQDLAEQRAAVSKLQAKLTAAETATQDAAAALEREKRLWEAETQQRLEEEKTRWQLETQRQNPLTIATHLRADSPSLSNRQRSPDPLGIYGFTRAPRSTASPRPDTTLSPIDRMLEDHNRRPSNPRHKSSPSTRTVPALGLISPSSTRRVVDLPAPSFDRSSSPHRTINDMISVSTVGAGPSVQLVERMSAAVRRLESEKATHKEEMGRLSAQRDEAREEVVALMREVDEARKNGDRVADLEKRMDEMQVREEAALDMLGEKTERVEELEGDVRDLKKIYRELVDTLK